MLELKDFKTLYNMVIASFIILTFNLLLNNYDEKGELINHSELYYLFEGLHTVVVYWLGLAVIHFTIILITKIAVKHSKKYVWIPLYIMHQSMLLGFAIYASEH